MTFVPELFRLRQGSPWLCWVLLLMGAAPAFAQSGDAEYGKEMLEVRRCTVCHPVAGEGGGTAPDLGRRSTEEYSPAKLAAKMWTHAPVMWKGMEERNMPVPMLTSVDVMNLYAYFYSLRYFDPPGDASRGKEIFNSKKCSQCHALAADAQNPKSGPPVSTWNLMADPVAWVQLMWNHGGEMARQMDRAGIAWPEFTLQEMADLLEYVESQPALQGMLPIMRVGDWSLGGEYFKEKGCADCHTIGKTVPGKVDLLAAAKGEPHFTGLAVEMWNHRPLMAAKRGTDAQMPLFEPDQMGDLLAYLFHEGYSQAQGDAQHGKQVYAEQGCASCHDKGVAGAQDLRKMGVDFKAVQIAASVWQHGPAMKAHMDYHEKDWPQLTEKDVRDLIAFLNQR